jgi:hypothetical protein
VPLARCPDGPPRLSPTATRAGGKVSDSPPTGEILVSGHRPVGQILFAGLHDLEGFFIQLIRVQDLEEAAAVERQAQPLPGQSTKGPDR